MQAQWQYGYARATEALLRQPPHDPSAMRRVGRYNRAES
jgi:hypothetical protein